ncbi:MAG: hypothetical protein IKN72_05800 [Clostridia bacterium]|nr:hypothetical protein [Clostridia bacterium]
MKKPRRSFDDDDGRSIADMSGVQRDRMFLPRSLKKHGTFAKTDTDAQKDDSPKWNGSQRRSAVGGAISAAALIAGIFIGAGAILIWLLTLIWH